MICKPSSVFVRFLHPVKTVLTSYYGYCCRASFYHRAHRFLVLPVRVNVPSPESR